MESMFETQFMRQHGAPTLPHHPRPSPASLPPPPMFRSRPEVENPNTKFSAEERAILLARSHLLRANFSSPQTPFSSASSHPSFSPIPGLPNIRNSFPHPLGQLPLPLHSLWSQWAQLQQLNSALLAQSQAQAQSPAAIFSNILNQAQRFSPYVISPPSPPSPSLQPPPRRTPPHPVSRTPSPVQVET